MAGRSKRRGKSKFIMIEAYIFKCEAFRSLTCVERCLYAEMKWRYNGTNNGWIGFGCREAAEALGGISKSSAARAFQSLEEKGFIRRAQLSGFNMKNRTATEWRLTEHVCNRTGELATKEFLRWRAGTKKHSPTHGTYGPTHGTQVA